MSEFAQYTPDDTNRFSKENMDAAKDNLSLRFSPFEAGVESFMNTANFTEALSEKSRMFVLGLDTREEKLTPEQIKQKYGLDTDESLNESQISLLQQRDQRERSLQNVLSNIDPYGFGRQAYPIVGGLINGLVDPLALATGMVVDKGLTSLASMGRIAKVTSSLINSPAKNIAAGVTRGVVSGAAEAYLDDYVARSHAQQFGLEYTKADSFLNIGLSITAGGILGGLGAGLDNVQSRKFRQAQESINAFESGRQPKDFYVQAYDRDRFGRYDNGTTDTPPVNPKGPTEGVFYGAHVSNDGNFNFDTQRNFNTKLGQGVVFTNNRDFAFNEATSSIDGNGGQIVEINAENLNLLNIDEPMPDYVREIVRKNLEDNKIKGPDVDELLKEGRSTKEVLNFLNDVSESDTKYSDLVNNVNSQIKDAEGLDGYSFRHTDSEGNFVGGDEDGAMFLFDPERVTARGVEEVDSRHSGFRTGVEGEAQQMVDYYQSRESHLFYDVDEDEAFEALSPMPEIRDPVQDIPVIQQEIAEVNEEFTRTQQLVDNLAEALDDLSEFNISQRVVDEIVDNTSTGIALPVRDFLTNFEEATFKKLEKALRYSERVEDAVEVILREAGIRTLNIFENKANAFILARDIVRSDAVSPFILSSDNLRRAVLMIERAENSGMIERLDSNLSTVSGQDFTKVDAVATNDIDSPLEGTVSTKSFGPVYIGNDELSRFTKLRSMDIRGKKASILLDKAPAGGHMRVVMDETKDVVGYLRWYDNPRMGLKGIDMLFASDAPDLQSPFIAPAMIKEALKAGAPPMVEGSISQKAADLVNALRARELQREARKQMQKARQAVQEEIASNPQDMVEQAARAATFCVRNNP
jgi:hypothetical protein